MFAIAGSAVFITTTLGYFAHPAWLLLTGLIGLNMLQAAFTRFCPMVILLKKLGKHPGQAFH